MIKYEIIEHTADLGIRVKGVDLKDLFKNTASAMFDIIAERQSSTTTTQDKIEIRQQAENWEELLVNWLNELLSLSATKDLIFVDFQINKLSNNNIEAVAIGENIKNFKLNTEIKAATYHQLKLEKFASGWQAEVIFDV